MKNNLKQPIYDPANLINFNNPHLWMGQVKNSKTEYARFPFAQVSICIAIVVIVTAIIKLKGGI